MSKGLITRSSAWRLPGWIGIPLLSAMCGVSAGYLLALGILRGSLQGTWSDIDELTSRRAVKAPHERIVLVSIDAATIRSAGGLKPVPRAVIGEIIRRISTGHPRAIVLYLGMGAESRRGSSDDRLLGEAIKDAGCVVMAVEHVPPRDGRPESVIAPLPRFAASSRGVGLAMLWTSDGVVRTAPMARTIDGRKWHSLPEVVASVTIPPRGDRSVEPVPSSSDTSVIINFLGPPGSFPRVSALALLRGEVEPSVLSGAIVLIGLSGTSSGDMHKVSGGLRRLRHQGGGPRGWLFMDGIEIEANLIHTVLTGSAIRYAPSVAIILRDAGVSMLIAVTFVFLRGVAGYLPALLVVLVLPVLSKLGSWVAFSAWNLVFVDAVGMWGYLFTIVFASLFQVSRNNQDAT